MTEADEREATVTGRLVDGLRDYASLMVDLMHVRQLLAEREKLKLTPDSRAGAVFTRRALWEAAIVSYGRCFASGKRQTNAESLLAKLDPPLRDCHREIINLRNAHIAHHDDPPEEVTADAVFDDAGDLLGVRLRVYPSMGPFHVTHDPDTFAKLTAEMHDLVWELKVVRLARRIMAESDLAPLSAVAVQFVSQSRGAGGAMRVTYDIPLTDD